MINKNFDEVLEELALEIENQEEELKTQITENHTEIMKNAASLGDFEFHHGLDDITQKLNDFTLSICLNEKELKENIGMAEKCNEVHMLLGTLKDILERIENNDNHLQNYQNYNKINKSKKIFKKCAFYDKLKVMINNKKDNILNTLKKQSDGWLVKMINLYGDFGDRTIKNEPIDREELLLTQLLCCLFICKKMDKDNEFFDYFNARRKKIENNLKIYEVIGFLYVESILYKIDKHFLLKEINVDFDKEELIVLIKYIKHFGLDSKDAEQKLEKICYDFIIENRENINSKNDVDIFIKNGENFLKNIDTPAVIEFYYKVVDDLITKNYPGPELEDKIKKVHKFKKSEYKFKAYDKLKELRENEYKKIDQIFKEEKYDKLRIVMIDDKIIEYIQKKFLTKFEESDDKKNKIVEKEICNFYVYLKGFKEKNADFFFNGVKQQISKKK